MNSRFQVFIEKFIPTFKRLFLIDGLGAFLTAFSLGVILVRFEEIFGMPIQILYGLSFVACIFAIYSMTCHFLISKNWKPFLKVIITANLLYCVATIVLMFLCYQELTAWGFGYFILELMVVFFLVYIEILMLSSSTES